jgi:hypothetical protein
MEPTRDAVPAQSPASERFDAAPDPSTPSSPDVIQPSSMARVTWRLDEERPAREPAR